TQTIAVEGGGRIEEYPGGYSDWLAQRPAQAAAEKAPAKPKREEARPRPAAGKLSYKEQRELDELPDRIAALTAKVAARAAELADPALFGRDQKRYRQLVAALSETAAELEQAETRWLELEEKREALAAGRAGA